MPQRSSPGAPFSPAEALAAYEQVLAMFGNTPILQPGRIPLLGWDLDYVCGAAFLSFIDSLLIRRLADFVPDNDQPLILDCGANIGFSVLNYKRQFPQARIIAFEPDPQFVPVLRKNLERNGAGDVRLVEAAAWIRTGRAAWLCEGIDGSRIVKGKKKPGQLTTVRTVDLADYLKEPVDLLKMDVEGAEYRVISHLGSSLRKVKNILIECHLDQARIVSFGKLLKVLIKAGFKLGINSFGAWRDLIRRPPVVPSHAEQYILVAGWREPIPPAEDHRPILPYAGIQLEWELKAAKRQAAAEAQALRQSLAAAQARVRELEEREQDMRTALQKCAETGREAIETRLLAPPFTHETGRCWIAALPDLEAGADDAIHPTRSTLMMLENDVILNLSNSSHDDIRNLGAGRYSHWQKALYFSSSDGSDPNTNGRRYAIVFVNTARPLASA